MVAYGRIETYTVDPDPSDGIDAAVIFAQRYDPDGTKSGPAVQVTPDAFNAQPQSVLQLSNGDFVVQYVYYDPLNSEGQFPYPPYFSATQEIGVDGTPLGFNDLGLQDFGYSSDYRNAALPNGGYVYALDKRDSLGSAGFLSTKILGYVTAEGAIATKVLATNSIGDTPLPQFLQTESKLAVLQDGRFTIGWSEYYQERSEDYPVPPEDRGEREILQVYDAGGRETTAITVDFDKSKLVENFDAATGRETSSLLLRTDGSRVATEFGITGRYYAEQSIETDASGRIVEQKRYYGDAEHTLAFSQENRSNGTSEIHQYDASARETVRIEGVLAGERDAFQFNYAGSGATPSSVLLTHFGTGGGREFTDLERSDGSHVQTAFVPGLRLASHDGVADLFQGVRNGSDTFVFAGSPGRDTVSGFAAGSGANRDVLEIDSRFASSFADLSDQIARVGSDTAITLDAQNSILLKNVQPQFLTEANFHFAHPENILA